MNTFRTLLLLLLAAATAACAGSPPRGGEDSRDPDPGPSGSLADHPTLVFAVDGHDFGRQEKHRRISHTAVFRNGGNAPLEIREIRVHCGCAAVLASARRIPPGGRGALAVAFDTGRIPGRREKEIEIVTNDPVRPVTRYPIACTVVADAAVDPLFLVVRAARSAGPVDATFDVFSLRPGFDLEVEGVAASSGAIRSRVSRIPAGEPRTGYRVFLTFGPELTTGEFHERVTVTTNSARDRRLTVEVYGTLAETVLVSPDRLYLPRSPVGGSVARRFFLTRPDGKPFSVSGIRDPAGLFDIGMKRLAPNRFQVTVSMTGEAPATGVRGSLIVDTDAPGATNLAVPYEIAGAE